MNLLQSLSNAVNFSCLTDERIFLAAKIKFTLKTKGFYHIRATESSGSATEEQAIYMNTISGNTQVKLQALEV